MARYIDAEKLDTRERGNNSQRTMWREIKWLVDNAPTADVEEVKHGEWELSESKEHFNVVCSNCNEDFYVYKKGQYRIQNSNYCPNCGAKMDGDNTE